MTNPHHPTAHKGRGALYNPANRFHAEQVEAFDDGWTADEALPPPVTHYQPEQARSILSFNQSPDVPFDRSVNPYRGCEHGCIYCFARPSHAYLGYSPGLDFETRILYKTNAAALLEQALRKPGYTCAPLALGINTDAYQPIERKLGITRSLLEVLRAFHHPFTIVTKSALVERDMDILAELAEIFPGAKPLARVMISLATLQPELARRMDPRAAAPWRRLEAMRRLHQAGVPVGVLCAPIIPALNDNEMETLLTTAREHGASVAAYGLLRLPLEVEPLMKIWLDTHYPQRSEHVYSLMRQIHGGKTYNASFGTRMRGQGVFAEVLANRFQLAIRRLGMHPRCDALASEYFQVPARAGDQFSLAL